MIWRAIAAFAIAAVLSASDAVACSLAGPIDAKSISFAALVRDVDSIVIARAIAIDPSDTAGPENRGFGQIGEHSFRFETVERLKGDAPATFDLKGERGSIENYSWRSKRHAPIGEFWLGFGTEGACYSFISVVLGHDYLVLLSAKGELRDAWARGFEPLTADDEWLKAVRYLVANTAAHFARRTDVISFLRAFDLIAVVTPTLCGRPGVEAAFEVTPLWRGTELIDPAQPQQLYAADDAAVLCQLGETRLILAMHRPVTSDNRAIVRLPVRDGQIDLRPLVEEGDQGLGRSRYSLDAVIAPQVEVTGPLDWTLEGLAEALRAAPPTPR